MADRRLRIFHAAARQLSFTRAAEELHMTQPAVTLQVHLLEEHFNTRLLDRERHGLRLTEAGKQVFSYADRIFALHAEMEQAVQAATGNIAGVLLLGASTTISQCLLPVLLNRFRQTFPEISVRLRVGNTEEIVESVKAQKVNPGVVEGIIASSGLEAELFHTDELVAVMSPDHVLARRDRLRPAELLSHPFVAREMGSGTRESLDTYLRAAGLELAALPVAMELGGLEAIKGVVEKGLGISVLSRATVTKELQLGTLVSVPFDPPLERPLSFVSRQTRCRLRTAETLIRFARDEHELQGGANATRPVKPGFAISSPDN